MFKLKISVLVDLEKPMLTGDNIKCSLTLQVPEFGGHQTHLEQLLCQKYNQRATGVSVYSAAKQTYIVLIKKLVNSRHFSFMP